MVTYNTQQRSFDPTAPKPEVEGLLPDVPGGELGLLPEALTRADLKVWFTVPPLSNPTLWEEKYELFVDDDSDAIATRYWTTPIADSDRYLVLPSQWLRNNDGQHRTYYKTTIYNGAENYSFDLVMTLDTKAPVLAADSKLIFPPEVSPPPKQITARYLEQPENQDQVLAKLPDYSTRRPGDRIVWYFGEHRGDANEGGVIVLDNTNYLQPVVVVITGSLLRERGDGLRYAFYRVWDRAGNVSVYSEPVEVDVAATPIPRVLPWPSVDKAAGTGQQQTLDPLEDPTGAVVVIPETAIIYPDETAWVQWGVPGTVGAHKALVPINAGERRYAIPMRSVAAFIGKTLPVSYFVVENGKDLPSEERQLSVKTLPINRLPTVQCENLSGGSLSYARIPTTGARVNLAAWTLMTTDQHLEIRIYGVPRMGGETYYPAVRPRAVLPAELTSGIRAEPVPKAFFDSLQRDTPLSCKVYVSFDGGATWPPLAAPNFPLLQLTFTD
ncbi:hypothetical protein ACYZTL_04060 [Pseudomonas sp. LB3P81]